MNKLALLACIISGATVIIDLYYGRYLYVIPTFALCIASFLFADLDRKKSK